MHTNDTHAHLDNIAKRTTAIKNVRAKKPNALLLDAGDVFSGTLYFNEFQGKADLAFMNLLRYDAMTFGNHEFDLGSSPEGHQALANFIKGANFPFISANVDFSADKRFTGLFTDLISSKPEKGKIYNGIIKEINGEKVGIFGLTTEETKDISSPGSIVFENYIKEAEKAVKAFEGQGVDKIIALTHIGYDDNAKIDNDLILASTVKGIDVIVGGHSHTQLNKPVVVGQDNNNKTKDPTVIVQAYQYSDYLGTVDVEFDSKGKVITTNGELIKLSSLADDAEAANLLKKYADKIKEVSSKAVGAEALSELSNPRTSDTGISVRNSETALGNIITDGMLAKAIAQTKNSNIIMALQNGGGIRSNIDAGDITVGEVISVLPFGNTLATMTLTGAELKRAFEISFKESPKESGGFLHVSGAKVEYDSSKPVGKRVISIKYKDKANNYTEIKDEVSYTVATNAFTAKGGDGYDVFKKAYEEGRVTDLGLSDWENLAEHLASLKKINPTIEGRIVDVSEEENPNTELPGGNVAGADFSGTTSTPKVYKESVTVDITDISSLSNAVIKGDLIITGTLSKDITISNIKIEGDLVLSSIVGKNLTSFNNIEVAGETIF
ncbi:bifunctional metallophosphatase/5'-nucleotidase [Viridibacillus sp. NPDC093762]|uniref:bifunctional metallophosphatase/5'-nucleotidase n=1 Tax=Viridibacillus sp. NPDC093762 TaxID=3390720 RepID=UPI003D02953A